jgi:serine phosphatase RsbU (regulator of sigma subunit)
VENVRGQTVDEMLKHVLGDVQKFVSGAAQSDDLTIWMLKHGE